MNNLLGGFIKLSQQKCTVTCISYGIPSLSCVRALVVWYLKCYQETKPAAHTPNLPLLTVRKCSNNNLLSPQLRQSRLAVNLSYDNKSCDSCHSSNTNEISCSVTCCSSLQTSTLNSNHTEIRRSFVLRQRLNKFRSPAALTLQFTDRTPCLVPRQPPPCR